MDGSKKSTGATFSRDGCSSMSEYCTESTSRDNTPRQYEESSQLQEAESHYLQNELSYLSGHRGHQDSLATQRDPTSSSDDQGITRVVPGPNQWSTDAPASRACGDTLPEHWHRRRQKRSEEVGKIVGPQLQQEQAGEPHAQAQRSSDDIFFGPAQRQPQTFQSRSPASSSLSSTSSRHSLSPEDYFRPQSFLRNRAGGLEDKLPYVGLGRGPFLKLTQSPPIDVTRSPLQSRASYERKQTQDITDSTRPSSNDAGLKSITDDKHEPSIMLGASRWAPPSEQGNPKKEEHQKRPLIQPSKWAAVESSSKESSRPSPSSGEGRRRSSSNRGSSRDANIRPHSLQASKWATAEPTAVKKVETEARADHETKISQHHAIGRRGQIPLQQDRGRHHGGRKPRSKSRNSVHAEDMKSPPGGQAEQPSLASPKALTPKPIGINENSVSTSANAHLSVPTDDQGFQIRGHANWSRNRSPHTENTAEHQGTAAESAIPLTSTNEEHEKASASPAAASSKHDLPKAGISAERHAIKQDEEKESLKAISSLDGNSSAENTNKVGAPSEVAPSAERRRRPSATYIPPHLRRRMQEEKLKQQTGTSSAQAAHNPPSTLGAAGEVHIRGRDSKQSITSQRQFGDVPQHGYDTFSNRFPPSGPVGISPQGPMPSNIGSQRFPVSPASSYPGPYNRQGVQSQVGGYHISGTSRTAYASVNMPSQTPGVMSSWDQRFSQSSNLSTPHYQGHGPRMMPQHPQTQPRSMPGQPSYLTSSPASSYPPLSRGMMSPQFGQQQSLPQGHGFLQPSKHVVAGSQASSPSPPTQPRHPEGFEQVSQNHLRYNPHHGWTPPHTTAHTPVEATPDDLAGRMSAVRLHDKSERGDSGAGQWRHDSGRGKSVQYASSEMSSAPHMSGQADDDLKAQAEERERNRFRKLQAAKSRGWDSRKMPNGHRASRDNENDPERLALRDGPNRLREDMERRKMLLSNNDDDEDDGIVYPEPGRLEPIDFGDEFAQKDDKANKPDPDVSGGEKGKGQQSTKQEVHLTPLPDVIAPGTSWADLMDEEDWH